MKDQSFAPIDATADEAAAFAALQARLAPQYAAAADRAAPQTVVILPSLTLDAEILGKIEGVIHYEQRLLCLLFLLRYPRSRVIYLTSEPLAPAVVDYYLHLLPGIPHEHARKRLTLLSCHDTTARPLTEKVLERPRLVERLRSAIRDRERTHLVCFNVSALERRLAVRLGVPLYGCDPTLLPLGSKSGSRRLFREAGVPLADGAEDLADRRALAEATAALKRRDPALRRVVVKLNEGFSGEGNAILDLRGAPEGAALNAWVARRLPKMRFVAGDLGWEGFEAKLAEMGGVVEAFVEGRAKRSPSVQYRVDPHGRLEAVSTHDQVTGGLSGQVYEGCRFPAEGSYRRAIQEAGRGAAEALARAGVVGNFGIDFVSVRGRDGWRHHAVEINLRKGGTTHPFLMLQHLTDGQYDEAEGVYRSRSGKRLCYRASDNVCSASYRGLTPEDLVDIAVEEGLHFNALTQEGVAFHMIGALSGFGKLGMTCVAATARHAERIHQETVEALDRAVGT
ncbi:MAG: peptide ligase PGM1-related protein [Paracoccaceae bacterium]